MDNIDTKKYKNYIHFTGCGGLYPYYLGIASVIQEHFVVDDKTLISSSSAGCISSSLLICNKNINNYFYNEIKDFINDLKANPSWRIFNINNIARNNLNNFFNKTENKNLYKEYNKKGIIFINEINRLKLKNIGISNWDNNDDVINCMMASCYIPFYGPLDRITEFYKGKRCIDGNNYCDKNVNYLKNKLPTFIIDTRWRDINYNWYYFWGDFEWAEKLFNWGKDDAYEHINEISNILKFKKK